MNEQPPQPGQKPKWWWSTKSLIVAFVVAGPFALPFLWMNPRYSLLKKFFWTVVTVALTYYMVKYSMESFDKILQQYRDLGLLPTS